MILLVPGIVASAREPKPVVTFSSECSCEGDHAESRWQVKTDLTEPPAIVSQIQQTTPSAIFSWAGPGVSITRKQDRVAAEQQWYAVTGSVVDVRAEEDGDVHVVLEDATAGKPGKVVVELPLEARWCAMRTMVFSWTDATFPFETRRGNQLTVKQPLVVTVIGKAFYDVDHSGKDTKNNRRNYDPQLAVWEIHPVMKLLINDRPTASITGSRSAAPPVQPTTSVMLSLPVALSTSRGVVTLPAGTRLPVISGTQTTLRIQYMGQEFDIPVSSTGAAH